MKHEEHYIQAAFFKWCAMRIGTYPQLKWAHAICNSAKLTPRQGAWLKAEGKKPGVWDVFIPYPIGSFCGLYIEFKSGKNRLTPEQEAYRNDLQKYYAFTVCYSLSEAIEAVRIYFL
jgi:hypothetical protein